VDKENKSVPGLWVDLDMLKHAGDMAVFSMAIA